MGTGEPPATTPAWPDSCVHQKIRQRAMLLGTHQGAVSPDHLPDDLDEFTFRFNRRTSKTRGQLFFRLMEQAVALNPIPDKPLLKPKHNL